MNGLKDIIFQKLNVSKADILKARLQLTFLHVNEQA